MPTFGSLFTGIGGFDLGLERAGWEARWQVEIDEWRSQILERHWPERAGWNDIRTFPPFEHPDWPVDLICGGFPCQDLSVAGKRAGLAGERSGLFFEFARVVALLKPRWVLVENVPGLLSSHEGQDMGIVLETLSEFGYGLAWRVLNSQHFGVPQRRRRVYIVGHLGAPCPPEILFEPEGGGGDSQAGGKAEQEVAGSPRGGAEIVGPLVGNEGPNTHGSRGINSLYDVFAGHTIAQPLWANRWGGSDSHGDQGNVVPTLTAPNPNAAARDGRRQDGSRTDRLPVVCAPPDADGGGAPTGVPRWLDPCSRCPDGRRYAALGDAVTVNVIEWIGRRMLAAHQDTHEEESK